MRVFCVQLLLCGAASHCAAQGFQFLDFKSARGFNVVGDAKIHGKAVRLTPARHNKSGAFWMEARQPVTHGFDTTFRFQLTEQDHQHFAGADGFAFVVQNEGAAVIAGRGSAAGWDVADGYYNPSVRGIARSLAIFFDTFWNEDLQDPSGNYIAICTNGDGHWPARQLAYSKQLPVNLKDKRVHVARILFSPPKLSVYLDDGAEPVLTAAVELPEIAGPQGTAFVGFTAATGGGFQNHDVLSWSFGASVESGMVSSLVSFMPRPCLPNRTLCTPDEPVVELRAGGYHVIVPANLEWGASIENPAGKHIRIENVTGTVCWDPAAGVSACAGPEGGNQPRRQDLLDPQAAAGSLVTKTEAGRTYFSINDRAGEAFRDNEGYFEFDVRIE